MDLKGSFLRYKVLKAVNIKITAILVVTSCSLPENSSITKMEAESFREILDNYQITRHHIG
jgi:hypothetical protein